MTGTFHAPLCHCPPLHLAQPPILEAFSHTSICHAPQLGLRKVPCSHVEGQQGKQANLRPIRKSLVTQRVALATATEHWCQPSGAHGLFLYPSTTSGLTGFTPFLPRLHPDCTYQQFLPPFYPGFTLFWEGKMCRGKKEGKNGVNSFYPGVKTG